MNDSAFALPEGAAEPEHRFEGRLELYGEASNGSIQVIKGDPDPPSERAHLPEFDFEFVQSGTHLIPVRRGLILTEHPNWNLIIEPGRVWKEMGDQGYSRASFPFALVWKNSNATFNGAMTFLFDDERVSWVWYQITQETCWSFKADFWGALEAEYHPNSVPGADQVRKDYAQELVDRFPARSLEHLAVDYPGTDPAQFGRGITPEHMSTYGLVIGGVNYTAGCRTRYGEYAFCDSLRMPSYSTAKSAFVSVALMRLAQKYGPDVPDLLIKDFVPEYASSPGDWSKVTIDHTLDMATGNYRSTSPMVDEENFQTDPFWRHDAYAERIASAFNWPHSAEPGTQWVYRTSDTFIVTRALQNYLQAQEGPRADIFEFVVDEVFIPVGIGPGAHSTLRTSEDDWQGQPFGGYGLWWIQDDIAKVTTLLHNDGTLASGKQVLHPDLVATALQKDAADRGVRIDSNSQYNNAFWADKYGPADDYDCEFWVSEMLGYSGIAVVLMPNGSTYYYFSDNREFTWSDAVRASDSIIPHCDGALAD